MKLKSQKLCRAIGAGVFALSLVSGMAEATNLLVVAKTLDRPTTANSANSGAAAEEPALIPTSVFQVPRQPAEGKDPFFPNSTRVYGTDLKAKAAPTVEADIALKGISGSPEQPLAIINTTSFAVGEVNDVIHRSGRIKVKCLEINMAAGTVLIQIGSERRQLHLPSRK